MTWLLRSIDHSLSASRVLSADGHSPIRKRDPDGSLQAQGRIGIRLTLTQAAWTSKTVIREECGIA
jgi:hypothetical protein